MTCLEALFCLIFKYCSFECYKNVEFVPSQILCFRKIDCAHINNDNKRYFIPAIVFVVKEEYCKLKIGCESILNIFHNLAQEVLIKL